jgi:predicted nuclease with TOPRIM domain
MVEKERLEERIQEIRVKLLETQKDSSDLMGDLKELETKLGDLTKPKLTTDQMNEITDIIVKRVEDFPFDVGQFEFELDMDYDNTIQLCSLEFNDGHILSEVIAEAVLDLFGETELPDDDIS